MQFNKVVRGANRAVYEEETIFAILDAGFLCHIGFQHQEQSMMIPTAYGRIGESLYFHGSTKNFMLNTICNGQSICVGVTHLDGVVLAKSLFDASANYRSVVLFGKASIVEDEEERMKGLHCITENIIQGRWDEVPVGIETQLKATLVVKFTIDTASAKVRAEGPKGDELLTNEVWSGHIPLKLMAQTPIKDPKVEKEEPLSKSVVNFLQRYS